MEEKLKNWAFAAGEILAAIFTAANLALGYLDYIPGRSPLLLAAIGFLVFVILVFFHIIRRNALLESSQPNIQIDGEPNPHDVKVKNGAVASIVNIPFSNNPKYTTPYNETVNVLAHLEYLDENKRRLFSIKPGRWTDTKLPYELSARDHHGIQHIDFPNTGAIRWLEVLIKYPEDEFCYGFNNSSIRENEFWLNPDFKIEKKRFFVRVNLRGNYLRNKFWLFEVTTRGKGDTFQIRLKGKKWVTKTSRATKKVTKPVRKKVAKSPAT